MNEEDIVEAFVRHTLAYADAMLVLDNGSTDRTIEILGALKAEGLAIAVLQARSPIFAEPQHNTLLYNAANRTFRPDWILHLDADEFLDIRGGGLRPLLSALPSAVQAAMLPLVDYFVEGLDMTELIVPRRMRLRDAVDRGTRKCMLRGGLPGQVVVDPGQHNAWVNGRLVNAVEVMALRLAHYSVRHPVTGMFKAAMGRVKVLAAGGGPEQVERRNGHYTHLLEALCRDPAGLFADPHRMNKGLPPFALVEDPIDYAGGALRYTVPGDPVMQAIRAIANAAELLATSHGRLLDAHPTARAQLEAEACRAEQLFA